MTVRRVLGIVGGLVAAIAFLVLVDALSGWALRGGVSRVSFNGAVVLLFGTFLLLRGRQFVDASLLRRYGTRESVHRHVGRTKMRSYVVMTYVVGLILVTAGLANISRAG